MMTSLKFYIKIFLILALSSLFFLFLYFFDNKYTYSTSQPANGILVLTNDDIENDPLRFLCRGWCFYPDELLTPKDFTQANPSEYMVYRNIGEQTNFVSN